MAFAIDLPLILIPVGLVYIIEALSVIIQVGYFKISGGKRVFKMAPIHHHFEMCGYSEKQIVAAAFTITAVMCIVSYLWGIG
jgi:phospho-N-acetylmuramoyl-pentapeptide-transferase